MCVSDKEFERKFVLHNLPSIALDKPKHYQQGYIPNPVGLVMRLCQEGDKKVLQFKQRISTPGENFESPKLDLTNSQEIFESLMGWIRQSNGHLVVKERHTIDPVDAPGTKECVIDRFLGGDANHILLEVEFKTAEEMQRWKPYDWIEAAGYREVTGDARFNNEWIAEHGWPE